MKRYTIKDINTGEVVAECQTLLSAMLERDEYAMDLQEQHEAQKFDGDEPDMSFDEALELIEIYDNVAKCIAWTKAAGTTDRYVSTDEFEEEATPVSGCRVDYGRWEIKVSFRGKVFSATTTDEDVFDDDSRWARAVGQYNATCQQIEILDD